MSAIKQLRGQVRQIVKELIPELLTQVLVAEMQRVLQAQLQERLNAIDERQKDLQAYMVRTSPAMIKTDK